MANTQSNTGSISVSTWTTSSVGFDYTVNPNEVVVTQAYGIDKKNLPADVIWTIRDAIMTLVWEKVLDLSGLNPELAKQIDAFLKRVGFVGKIRSTVNVITWTTILRNSALEAIPA